MLTLYYAPGSSSLASHIALEEAGADYDTCLIDEERGEQRTDAYLRINPRGKVPALRLTDGAILVENVAILTYGAHTHPHATLLPEDPQDEARALSLMAFFATAVHPAFSHYWAPQRFTGEQDGEPGIRARGLDAFFGHCREIDALLADRDWFLNQYSVVDCYGFVFYGWGLRASLPMHELRDYTAHRDRMSARSAVRRVMEREASTRTNSTVGSH
jgi:glutathione S-transferase